MFAAAFKESLVEACRYADYSMCVAAASFYIRGPEVELPPVRLVNKSEEEEILDRGKHEVVRIYGSVPYVHESKVVFNGSKDVRRRKAIGRWYCLLPVQFVDMGNGRATREMVEVLTRRAGIYLRLLASGVR